MGFHPVAALQPLKTLEDLFLARQAEAEREKRAKIIHSEGELLASDSLVEAANRLSTAPGSMQLRYLQNLVEIASEQNSTILPIPMELVQQFKMAVNGN